MGNTKLLAPLAPPLDGTLSFVVAGQASDPQVLQASVQTLIDQLIVLADGDVQDVTIEGAGAGHTFVVTFLLLANGRGPAAGTIARVYMAANRPLLEQAFTLAVADLLASSLQVIAHGIAGADQGHRFCGLIIAQPIPG